MLNEAACVLVHGAWHDASCWNPLVPYLEASQLEVFTPDLPSHGKNPADPARTNLKAYSTYISQYIENIDKKVILVGHSMAGMVISQVAEEIPDKLARLLYLSAYLPENGQSLFSLIAANAAGVGKSPIEEVMQISADKRYFTINPQAIQGLFYNCSPTDQSPKAFPSQPALPFSGKVRLSEANYGRVPKTYICCLNDHVIPISHQRHMLKNQACGEMVQLDSDHSPFLSCPELLAKVLNSARKAS